MLGPSGEGLYFGNRGIVRGDCRICSSLRVDLLTLNIQSIYKIGS